MDESRGARSESTLSGLLGGAYDEDGTGEGRYRAIVESQAEMVCRFRPDGTILFANAAYAQARGTTPEALARANFWDFIDEEDRPAVRAMLDRLAPAAPEVRIENRFETTGGVRWTLWTNRALAFDGDGRATEVQSSGIDITDHKHTEQALRDGEARLSAILEQLPVGVGVTDAQGRTLSLNPAGLHLHGFASLGEMLTHFEQYREAFELRYPDGRLMPVGEWPLARALRGEYVHEYEVRLRRHPDDAERIVAYSAVPVYDGRDEASRIVFVMHDVTERWRAEQALKERERQLALVMDTAPALIAHCDREARFQFVNRAYARWFGLAPDDVVGRHVRDVMGQAAYDVVEPHIARVLTGRAVEFETEVEFSERGRRFLQARYAPERDADGAVSGFVAMITDITARKEAEEELRRAHHLIEGITRGTEDLIAAQDGAFRFLFFNEAYRREFRTLWGHDIEVGTSMLEVMAPWPEEQRKARALWQRALDGESFSITMPFGPSEPEQQTYDLRFNPVYDGQGRLIGAAHILRNVTEQVRMQEHLRESEERLRDLNRTLERRVAERTADLEDRNRELQTFAYIASHDLREPLRKIQAFAGLLQEPAPDHDERRLFLERIGAAAARMDRLLNDLLSFSRVSTHASPRTPVRLDEVVADVLHDFELVIEETNAQVTTQAAVTLMADAVQLRQLLANLIDNALRFRRANEPPRVRIVATLLDGDDAPAEAAGRWCRLTVEDNGIGFEARHGDRIFEPFERLHGRSAYEGTGMGLAICRRIVQRHGGTITAESTPGEGSRFIALLPVEPVD